MYKWNDQCYAGPLVGYEFPEDKEVVDLLHFLKDVRRPEQVFLIDQLYWNLPELDYGYDCYVICDFGEFVNEGYLASVDADPNIQGKKILLLTSQYFSNPPYKNIKVFYLEHLHTALEYLDLYPRYNRLDSRPYLHGALSNRQALHKLVIISALRQHQESLLYTFNSRLHISEYNIEDISKGFDMMYPEFDYAELYGTLQDTHKQEVIYPGHQWSITNPVYQQTQIN